jgi:hypothetical protein
MEERKQKLRLLEKIMEGWEKCSKINLGFLAQAISPLSQAAANSSSASNDRARSISV